MIAIIGKSILGQEIYNYLPVKNKIIISRSDGIQYIREDFVKKLKTAKAIIWAAGSYNAKDMQREHIKPIEELVSALKRQQKLIYTSSISVYGKSIKREIDENIEINPDTKYAMAKAKAEQIAKEHENTIIFRLGVLYSHKYKAYSTIFKLISLGICPYFGNGQNNVPFTYIKDVLPCYKNALSLQGNDIYNVSGKGCKQMYAIKIASQAIGKKPILFKMPMNIAVICDIFGCFLNTEAVKSISSDRNINNKKAIDYLGFNETPIDKGIKKEVMLWKKKQMKMKEK